MCGCVQWRKAQMPAAKDPASSTRVNILEAGQTGSILKFQPVHSHTSTLIPMEYPFENTNLYFQPVAEVMVHST
jgi:hypothetical protein